MAINIQPAFSVTPGDSTHPFNSEGKVEVFPGAGFDGMQRVIVDALPNTWIKPTGKVPDANVVNDTTFSVKPYAMMDAPHQVFTDKDIIEGQSNFSSLQRVEVPAGTTRITNLFKSHNKLQEIILPPSCNELMNEAFYNCQKLEKINLDNIISYGDSSFYSCYKLTGIYTINNNVIEIPSNCFYNVGRYNGITFILHDNITTIGESAFRSYTSSSSTSYNRIIINKLPNSLTSIGSTAFGNSVFINTDITLPGSLTNKISSSAFEGTNITSVIMNEGITSLGMSVFRNCENLTSVIVPSTITSFGGGSYGAFENCYNLSNVEIANKQISLNNRIFLCDNKKPNVPLTLTLNYYNPSWPTTICTCSTDAFTGRNIEKIRVPAPLLNTYKTATNWSAFADKIEAIA